MFGFRALEEGLHHFLAFGTGEIAALGFDDFHVGIFRKHFFKTLFAVDGRSRARGALQFDNHWLCHPVALASHSPARRPSSTKSDADEGDVERIVGHVDGPIQENDGNFRSLDFPEDGFPAGFDDRRKSNDIDALRDERAEGFDLIFLLLLRVGEFEFDAALFGFGLDRIGIAVRQPLSAPICEKPTTTFPLCEPDSPAAHGVTAASFLPQPLWVRQAIRSAVNNVKWRA